jgi:transposase
MLEHLSTGAARSSPETASAAPTTTTTTTLFLILEPVDMRLGIDGLSAAIQTRLSTSPCAGGVYLFMNARRNRLKLLLWDGTGVWLAVRRLHKGRFFGHGRSDSADSTQAMQIPSHLEISAAQWQWLSAGVDWQRLSASAHDQAHWRVG